MTITINKELHWQWVLIIFLRIETNIRPMSNNVCDERIYKDLFFQHGQAIRNFIYYKCGDLHRAEDIAQEAFIRIWNNCTKVTKEKAKSFLYTVANNLFIDSTRKDKSANNYLKTIEHKTTDSTNPLEVLQGNELKAKLNQAIQQLSSKRREVFLMNRMEHLTYKEIAERLQISVKAVEKRMHATLIELRKFINED